MTLNTRAFAFTPRAPSTPLENTEYSRKSAKLVFVATGPQQTFATIGTQAAALGIDLMTIDQVLGNIKYVPLNNGEAWGYLRVFPANVDTLRPTDIPVFDELPLDLHPAQVCHLKSEGSQVTLNAAASLLMVDFFVFCFLPSLSPSTSDCISVLAYGIELRPSLQY